MGSITISPITLAILESSTVEGKALSPMTRIRTSAWKAIKKPVVWAPALGVLAVAIVIGDYHHIARVLGDPARFTGRSAIWQAEIAYIRDHPLLGSGFGSFADTGSLSPLYHYVGAAWVQNVSHGHNAYLQLFVTIGGIGFALAMWSLVITPAFAFWRGNAAQIDSMSMLFTIFVFILLHNGLESDFLEGDGAAWVAFVLVLAMLRLSRSIHTDVTVEAP